MSNPPSDEETPLSHAEARLRMGEAYMMCRDCGARLYSFDGEQDASCPCPNPKRCREESIR